MPEKKVVLTYEGLKKMEDKLEYLKTVKRKEIAEKIKEARGQGDLSENAEYDAAKEEQAEVEAEIIRLEKLLRNAEIIDEEELTTDVISVGSKVTLYDTEFDEEVEYIIVGSAEADPSNGKLSNESPVGRSIIGRSAGETVHVDAPGGTISYKVLSIH